MHHRSSSIVIFTTHSRQSEIGYNCCVLLLFSFRSFDKSRVCSQKKIAHDYKMPFSVTCSCNWNDKFSMKSNGTHSHIMYEKFFGREFSANVFSYRFQRNNSFQYAFVSLGGFYIFIECTYSKSQPMISAQRCTSRAIYRKYYRRAFSTNYARIYCSMCLLHSNANAVGCFVNIY